MAVRGREPNSFLVLPQWRNSPIGVLNENQMEANCRFVVQTITAN